MDPQGTEQPIKEKNLKGHNDPLDFVDISDALQSRYPRPEDEEVPDEPGFVSQVNEMPMALIILCACFCSIHACNYCFLTVCPKRAPILASFHTDCHP